MLASCASWCAVGTPEQHGCEERKQNEEGDGCLESLASIPPKAEAKLIEG